MKQFFGQKRLASTARSLILISFVLLSVNDARTQQATPASPGADNSPASPVSNPNATSTSNPATPSTAAEPAEPAAPASAPTEKVREKKSSDLPAHPPRPRPRTARSSGT